MSSCSDKGRLLGAAEPWCNSSTDLNGRVSPRICLTPSREGCLLTLTPPDLHLQKCLLSAHHEMQCGSLGVPVFLPGTPTSYSSDPSQAHTPTDTCTQACTPHTFAHKLIHNHPPIHTGLCSHKFTYARAYRHASHMFIYIGMCIYATYTLAHRHVSPHTHAH